MNDFLEKAKIDESLFSEVPLSVSLATLKPKNKSKIQIIFKTENHQSTRVPLKPFHKNISRYI